MVLNDELLKKKARLISAGEIFLVPGTRLSYNPSKSTGGPDAGRISITLALDIDEDVRVKIALSKDSASPFSLQEESASGKEHSSYSIMYNNKPFLEGVKLVPTLLHAPGQAFINITPKCRYNCLFCASPLLDENVHVKTRSLDRWVEIIMEASRRSGFKAVALTSGVPDTPTKTVSDLVYVIEKVRSALPEVPIGVEPCINNLDDIERLHQAGATEIKINVQSYDDQIFKIICPGFDLEFIMTAIYHAVTVFGRNNVCSNLIIGLGESDESVKKCIENLARLGAVLNLRVLRINEYNLPGLEKVLPGGVPEPVEPDRLMELMKYQKSIFKKYDLKASEFRTMCHKCGACDL